MTQTRKRYDRQFKVAAARVVLEKERTVKELSEELGIKDTTLRRWAERLPACAHGPSSPTFAAGPRVNWTCAAKPLHLLNSQRR